MYWWVIKRFSIICRHDIYFNILYIFFYQVILNQILFKNGFNVGKIRITLQQLGQKLTPDNIQRFGTKVRDMALTIGRKVSNTLSKVRDIDNKLLPMTETAATAMGYGLEVLGFESARKGLEI